MKRFRAAIIPTRNRPEVFLQCVRAIETQVDLIYILNNGEDLQNVDIEQIKVNSKTQMNKMQPPNLSTFWNMGLNFVEYYVRNSAAPYRQWDVAILNDDAVVPPGWFDAVADEMRKTGAAAGCSGPFAALHKEPGPVGLETRLQGYAFILAGELGLRANEDIHWYFTDDYLDWESRKLGGMVMVPGYLVQHSHPNGQMTPELHEQCAKDAQTFFDLYGMRPW